MDTSGLLLQHLPQWRRITNSGVALRHRKHCHTKPIRPSNQVGPSELMHRHINPDGDPLLRKITILCVEDSPAILDLRETIENAGYRVLGTTGGTQGIVLLTSHPSKMDTVVLLSI
jgi:hypothetical protein